MGHLLTISVLFCQKINYSFNDEEEEDDNFNKSDDELFENNPEGRQSSGGRVAQGLIDDDSDIEETGGAPAEAISLDSGDDSPVKAPAKKPAAAKRKLGPKTDDGAGAKAASKRPRKKGSAGSSDDDKPKKVG